MSEVSRGFFYSILYVDLNVKDAVKKSSAHLAHSGPHFTVLSPGLKALGGPGTV